MFGDNYFCFFLMFVNYPYHLPLPFQLLRLTIMLSFCLMFFRIFYFTCVYLLNPLPPAKFFSSLPTSFCSSYTKVLLFKCVWKVDQLLLFATIGL